MEEFIEYLLHIYFVDHERQCRAVSAKTSRGYQSYIEERSQGDWIPHSSSSLDHPTKWSAEDRAHQLTQPAFNKAFLQPHAGKGITLSGGRPDFRDAADDDEDVWNNPDSKR